MKLNFSIRARRDLDEIGAWIARDDPNRAITFIDELRSACERLAEHPLLYAELEGFAGVRKKSHRGYLILFEIRSTTVEVVTIRHGARRPLASR